MQWPFGKHRGRKPRVEFDRPDGWHDLDGASDQPVPPAPPAPPPQPAPPPPIPSRPSKRQPSQPPPVEDGPPAPPRTRDKAADGMARKVVNALIVFGVVLGMALALAAFFYERADPDQPGASTAERRPPPRPADRAPVVWSLPVDEIREGLEDPQFENTPDGYMDSDEVIDAGDIWVVTSLETKGGDNQVHGLDADTGEVLWTRDMEGAYCAIDLLDDQVVCAEATAWEQGLGTQWTLHLLDPATGAVTAAAPFEGWVTGISVEGEHIVVLEQRLPAPHAVVTGLDATLTQVWQVDLAEYAGHEDMFSENRFWVRPERVPEGPALDRPRLRRVADGLTALWIGARTAFIDAKTGEVVGLPHCSRLIDDGELLWCNAGSHAVAYNYRLETQFHTSGGVRLAFPYRDPSAGDITIPAFFDSDGRLMDVDPATGEVRGVLARTATNNSLGIMVWPQTVTINNVLIVSDYTQTMGIDPETREVLWRERYHFRVSDAVALGDSAILGDIYGYQLDLATGKTLNSWRFWSHPPSRKGDRLASVFLDRIALLDIP